MTKKDIEIIERIVRKILYEMANDYEDESLSLQGSEETMFSMAMLQEMEAYLGYSIDFMGIS